MPVPRPVAGLLHACARAGRVVWRSGTLALALGLVWSAPPSAGLPERVAAAKRSVVAVGTYMPLRASRYEPRGSGFAVAPNHAVTNAHTLPATLDAQRKESYAVLIAADAGRAEARAAQVVRRDAEHDLCLLRFDGRPLPALSLGRSSEAREGLAIAFTGYPLVGALGFTAATHRGIVSAIAPVVLPAASGRELTPEVLKRMGKPFEILQLDATAYPGNSGSPVYDVETGRVLGVVNSVFVKRSKEAALTDPSGISYAIPVDHVRRLMEDAGLKP